MPHNLAICGAFIRALLLPFKIVIIGLDHDSLIMSFLIRHCDGAIQASLMNLVLVLGGALARNLVIDELARHVREDLLKHLNVLLLFLGCNHVWRIRRVLK